MQRTLGAPNIALERYRGLHCGFEASGINPPAPQIGVIIVGFRGPQLQLNHDFGYCLRWQTGVNCAALDVAPEPGI